MSGFKDNFSKQSDLYVKYRPHYPGGLFSFLSSLTPEHKLCWDCGTGNGQAAVYLAEYYDKVIATDPSEEQIKNAISHAKVIYKVEKAEEPDLDNKSVDLLTVANAMHWFNFDEFYKTANRVVKKNGIIAAWAYGLPTVDEDVNKLLEHLHHVVLNDFLAIRKPIGRKGYPHYSLSI